jgi:hypothetical protein
MAFPVPAVFSAPLMGAAVIVPAVELFTNTLRTMIENKDSFDEA